MFSGAQVALVLARLRQSLYESPPSTWAISESEMPGMWNMRWTCAISGLGDDMARTRSLAKMRLGLEPATV